MDRTIKLYVKGSIPTHGAKFSPRGAKFHGWGMGVWCGLGVRVLHFSHFRDEKSAFFQLEVRGLP